MLAIILLTLSGAATCAALLASVIVSLNSRRRAKQMAASLDIAVAELGAQQAQAASLKRQLNRREAFIDRNILEGPEAYSRAPPEGRSQQSCGYPVGEAPPHLFVVGSDDESDGGESENDSNRDDDENRWSVRGIGGLSPRPRALVSAVRIQPSEIKTVTLRAKEIQSPGVDSGFTVANVKGESPPHSQHILKKKESPNNEKPWKYSKREDVQPQNDSYWPTSRTQSPPEEAPRLAEGSTEVKVTTAEADQANTLNKDAS